MGWFEKSNSIIPDNKALNRRASFIRCLKVNIPIQLVLGMFTAMATDGGVLFQAWYFAMAAYWSLATLLWIFHRNRLSKTDVFLVKWGFGLALVMTPIAADLFWKLYGYT